MGIFNNSEITNRKENTEQAFKYPQVGDLFTEMYSYWALIIKIEDAGTLSVWEPNSETLSVFKNKSEFEKYYSYGCIPGYWVTLCDKNRPVQRYLDYIESDEFIGKVLLRKEASYSKLEEEYRDLLLRKGELIKKEGELDSRILAIKTEILKVQEVKLRYG